MPFTLSHDREGAATVGAEAKNRKVIVEGSGAFDSQASHDGETRPVDNRKILVTVSRSGFPGGLQIGGDDCLDRGNAVSQAIPKRFGGAAVNAIADQGPGLDQHMICSD